MVDSCSQLFSNIKARNSKDAKRYDTVFARIKQLEVGSGLLIRGEKVVNLQNVTQDDKTGNTGDILLITNTGKMFSVSIQEGKPKKDGHIEKCLSNPTAKRFGCSDEKINTIKKIRDDAILPYKEEMTRAYGSDESVWSRKKSNVASQTCTQVAIFVKTIFDSLPYDTRCQIMYDLLHCNPGVKPADYLVMVNKKDFSFKMFEFSNCQIPTWSPTIKTDGIYLDIYANESLHVARVQVKFNNGIWHNGKTSSLTSSWNLTCNLTTMFTMNPITL
jgi:hypothetical protein